ALEQNDVELDVEALERTAHPGRPAADHDDIVLLVGHGRPTRARRSDSSLTERSDPWTAATHRRATNLPHAAPTDPRSVSNSPAYRNRVWPGSSVSSKLSATNGTGPRTSRNSTRSGGTNRTVSTVIAVSPAPIGVRCSASTRSLPRSITRSLPA